MVLVREFLQPLDRISVGAGRGEDVSDNPREKTTVHVEFTASIIEVTMETDVPTLQRMLRQSDAAHNRAIDRLRKARSQRNTAQAEVSRLQTEVNLLLKRLNDVNATKNSGSPTPASELSSQ